jgi:hypothetical protein
VIALAVVVAHNLELTEAERRKQGLHTVSEHNSVEVADPIVVHKEVVGAARMVVVHTEMEVADPTAVRMEIVVGAVRTVVEVVHTEVVVPNLVVGSDHKTWIIPSP